MLFFDLILVTRNIFDEDNYTPILCEDESQYIAILKEFPFEDSELQVLWLLWAAFALKKMMQQFIDITVTVLRYYVHCDWLIERSVF